MLKHQKRIVGNLLLVMFVVLPLWISYLLWDWIFNISLFFMLIVFFCLQIYCFCTSANDCMERLVPKWPVMYQGVGCKSQSLAWCWWGWQNVWVLMLCWLTETWEVVWPMCTCCGWLAVLRQTSMALLRSAIYVNSTWLITTSLTSAHAVCSNWFRFLILKGLYVAREVTRWVWLLLVWPILMELLPVPFWCPCLASGINCLIVWEIWHFFDTCEWYFNNFKFATVWQKLCVPSCYISLLHILLYCMSPTVSMLQKYYLNVLFCQSNRIKAE